MPKFIAQLTVLSYASMLSAHSSLARVGGTIYDPRYRPVAGAKIPVRSATTGAVRPPSTDDASR